MDPDLRAILDTLAVRALDPDGAWERMVALAQHGEQRIYAACCVWSEAMVTLRMVPAAGALEPGASTEQRRRNWGMGIMDEDGHQLDPAVIDDPPMVWAMRFVTAQANRDAPMTVALFEAMPREEAPAYVWALLTLTAAALLEDH